MAKSQTKLAYKCSECGWMTANGQDAAANANVGHH